MHGKWAETRAARELHELNLAFLGLLRKSEAERPAFGLDAGTWRQLFGLSPGQLEVIARMPCLLAGFAAHPAPRATGVAEAGPLRADPGHGHARHRDAGRERPAPARPLRTVAPAPADEESPLRSPRAQPTERLAAELRLYAVGLLTWLWQTARQDPLLAILCTGPEGLELEELGAMRFTEIQRAGAAAGSLLEARFCRHPRLWPDLLRAARSGERDIVVATQLSVVQLTLIERRPRTVNAVRRSELRSGRQPALRAVRRPDAPG